MIDFNESKTKMKILVDHLETAKTSSRKFLFWESDHDKILTFDSERKTAKDDQEKYVMITSLKSYKKQVFEILCRVINQMENSGKRNQKLITECHDNVQWSHAVQDKFHQAKNPGMLRIKIFSSLLDKSYFWFLSDMLFDIEFEDIVDYTSLLEKSEWATHLILNIETIKNLTQMKKTVVQITKSDQIEQFDKIAAELEDQLLS